MQTGAGVRKVAELEELIPPGAACPSRFEITQLTMTVVGRTSEHCGQRVVYTRWDGNSAAGIANLKALENTRTWLPYGKRFRQMRVSMRFGRRSATWAL